MDKKNQATGLKAVLMENRNLSPRIDGDTYKFTYAVAFTMILDRKFDGPVAFEGKYLGGTSSFAFRLLR